MVALMSDGIESPFRFLQKIKRSLHLFYDPFFKVFSHEAFDQFEIEKSLNAFLIRPDQQENR
jgi:hypothetical protein